MKPDNGPERGLRFGLTFLLPKSNVHPTSDIHRTWQRAARPHHRSPGRQSAVRMWQRGCRLLSTITLGFLTASCSHSQPLLRQQTPRGPIQYTLHSPETPARQHVILAHGFLRNPQTMHHLAEAFSKQGIETACIDFKRSTPFNGNHAANARDLIALRQALGWKKAAYAGFSAGGLSALLAAAEDKACTKLLLLDPVDHGTLGLEAAQKIRVPTLAILGKPGPGNARRNATPMLDAIPNGRTLEIPEAHHFDFEANPSPLLQGLTGAAPAADRTTAVHQEIIRHATRFLIHSINGSAGSATATGTPVRVRKRWISR